MGRLTPSPLFLPVHSHVLNQSSKNRVLKYKSDRVIIISFLAKIFMRQND